MAPRSTPWKKRTWGRWFFLAGALAALVAGLVMSAPAAFTAETPTGHEELTTPVPVGIGVLVGTQAWTPPVDSNANPINGIPADIVTGTGYVAGGTVFGMVCDGNPPTAARWSVASDCDSLTATTAESVGANGNPAGQVTLGNNVASEVGVFRGIGPNDQFNCLAPLDNPNGSTVNVPNLPTGGLTTEIDNTVPSWGAGTVGAQGGGTAPCTIRIGYQSVNLSTTSDKFFPLALAQNASNIPPPVRTITTVPNPNLPITAPAAPSPTTSAPPTAASPAGSSAATTVTANPLSPTTSTSAGVSGTGKGSATNQRCDPPTNSTVGTSTTLCASSSSNPRGGFGAGRLGSGDSAQGGQSTESASSPTTVQLVAASTLAGATNSQAYWYLLAGAGVCAVGVWVAELHDSIGGRDGLARRGVSGHGNES